MSIRVGPSSCASAGGVVSTTVPTKPPAIAPQTVTSCASAIATAALISARWTSPCGKLPRNSPVSGIDLLA